MKIGIQKLHVCDQGRRADGDGEGYHRYPTQKVLFNIREDFTSNYQVLPHYRFLENAPEVVVTF